MTELIETDIGLLPKHWKLIPFNNALKVKGRVGWKGYKTSDLRNEGPVVIGGTNIKANLYLDFSQTTYLSREKFDESPEIMLQKGDVILVTRGNGIGDVGYFDGQFSEATINPSLVILSKFIGNSKYLFYYLNSPQGRSQVLSIEGGTSIPALYQGHINTLICPIPPVKEQNSIVDILSGLDEKVDLLHRQNITLEQLAETLFRRWFVEEVEEGWEVGKLEDIAKFHNGKSRPKETELGKIPIYGGNGILGHTNQTNYSGISIIIGRVGAYCGSLYIENKPIWLSDNALLARDKQNNNFFLFYLLKRLELNSFAEGSSHPLLTQTLLNSIKIVIPPNEKINEFEGQSKQFWSKIYKNIAQINTLTQLRDALLPKLMSGEVRINN